jgi:hypothetical protein
MTDTTSTSDTPTRRSGDKIVTFFEHIGEWLKDHLGDAQSVEHQAATGLAVLSPLLSTLLTLTAGSAVATKVASYVAAIQTKLANASALLNGAETTVQNGKPITLDSVLTGIKGDMAALLADADVKNSAEIEKIESVCDTIIGEVEVIQAATAGHVAPVVGISAA